MAILCREFRLPGMADIVPVGETAGLTVSNHQLKKETKCCQVFGCRQVARRAEKAASERRSRSMLPKHQEIEVPLLAALGTLGGTGRPQQIYEAVTKSFPGLTEADLAERLQGG